MYPTPQTAISRRKPQRRGYPIGLNSLGPEKDTILDTEADVLSPLNALAPPPPIPSGSGTLKLPVRKSLFVSQTASVGSVPLSSDPAMNAVGASVETDTSNVPWNEEIGDIAWDMNDELEDNDILSALEQTDKKGSQQRYEPETGNSGHPGYSQQLGYGQINAHQYPQQHTQTFRGKQSDQKNEGRAEQPSEQSNEPASLRPDQGPSANDNWGLDQEIEYDDEIDLNVEWGAQEAGESLEATHAHKLSDNFLPETNEPSTSHLVLEYQQLREKSSSPGDELSKGNNFGQVEPELNVQNEPDWLLNDPYKKRHEENFWKNQQENIQEQKENPENTLNRDFDRTGHDHYWDNETLSQQAQYRQNQCYQNQFDQHQLHQDHRQENQSHREAHSQHETQSKPQETEIQKDSYYQYEAQQREFDQHSSEHADHGARQGQPNTHSDAFNKGETQHAQTCPEKEASTYIEPHYAAGIEPFEQDFDKIISGFEKFNVYDQGPAQLHQNPQNFEQEMHYNHVNELSSRQEAFEDDHQNYWNQESSSIDHVSELSNRKYTLETEAIQEENSNVDHQKTGLQIDFAQETYDHHEYSPRDRFVPNGQDFKYPVEQLEQNDTMIYSPVRKEEPVLELAPCEEPEDMVPELEQEAAKQHNAVAHGLESLDLDDEFLLDDDFLDDDLLENYPESVPENKLYALEAVDGYAPNSFARNEPTAQTANAGNIDDHRAGTSANYAPTSNYVPSSYVPIADSGHTGTNLAYASSAYTPSYGAGGSAYTASVATSVDLQKIATKKKKNDAYDFPEGFMKPIKLMARIKLTPYISKPQQSHATSSTVLNVPPPSSSKKLFFEDLPGLKAPPLRRAAPAKVLEEPKPACETVTGALPLKNPPVNPYAAVASQKFQASGSTNRYQPMLGQGPVKSGPPPCGPSYSPAINGEPGFSGSGQGQGQLAVPTNPYAKTDLRSQFGGYLTNPDRQQSYQPVNRAPGLPTGSSISNNGYNNSLGGNQDPEGHQYGNPAVMPPTGNAPPKGYSQSSQTVPFPTVNQGVVNSGIESNQHPKASRDNELRSLLDPYIPASGPYAPSAVLSHSRKSSVLANPKDSNPYAPHNGGKPGRAHGAGKRPTVDRTQSINRQSVATKPDPNARFHRQISAFTWSPSDQVVAAVPQQSTIHGYSTPILTGKASDLIPKIGLYSEFPGPLIKGKTKKKDLENWLSGHIEKFRARGLLLDELTIAEILRVLLQNDGAFMAPSVRKELAEVLAPHIDFRLNPGVISSVRAGAPNAHRIDSASAITVWNYIQSGNTNAALQFALYKEDWALAMILAQALGAAIFTQVCCDYARKYFVPTANDKALYMMPILMKIFVGNAKGIVEDFERIPAEGDFARKFYKDIIAAALVNGASQEFFVEFGQFLADSKMSCASEVCFIVSGLLLSPVPLPNGAVFGVVGAFTQTSVYTEIYEYIFVNSASASSSLPTAGFPHTFPIKIRHAQVLADIGAFAVARRYCDFIGGTLRALGKNPILSPQASDDFQKLVVRLTECASGDSNWMSNTFSKVNLDSMWGTLDKFIGGEATSTKPEKGVFSNFSPSVSRNTSQLDVTQIHVPQQRGDIHGPPYTGSSAVNSGYSSPRRGAPPLRYAPVSMSHPGLTGSEMLSGRGQAASQSGHTGSQSVPQSGQAGVHSGQQGFGSRAGRVVSQREQGVSTPPTAFSNFNIQSKAGKNSRASSVGEHATIFKSQSGHTQQDSIGSSVGSMSQEAALSRIIPKTHSRVSSLQREALTQSTKAPVSARAFEQTSLEVSLNPLQPPQGPPRTQQELPENDSQRTLTLGHHSRNQADMDEPIVESQAPKAEPPRAEPPKVAPPKSEPKQRSTSDYPDLLPVLRKPLRASRAQKANPYATTPSQHSSAEQEDPQELQDQISHRQLTSLTPKTAFEEKEYLSILAAQAAETQIDKVELQVQQDEEALDERVELHADDEVSSRSIDMTKKIESVEKSLDVSACTPTSIGTTPTAARNQAYNPYGSTDSVQEARSNLNAPRKAARSYAPGHNAQASVGPNVGTNPPQKQYQAKLRAANLDISFETSADDLEIDAKLLSEPLILNSADSEPAGVYLNPYDVGSGPERPNVALDDFPIPNTPEYTSRANSVVGQPGLYSSRLSQQSSYLLQYEVKDDTVIDYVPVPEEEDDEDIPSEVVQKIKFEKVQDEMSSKGGAARNEGGWFKSFLGSKKDDGRPKPTKANLGNFNTFQYDEKLRRWIDTSRPLEEQIQEKKATKPPPMKPKAPGARVTSDALRSSASVKLAQGPIAAPTGPTKLEDLLPARAPGRPNRKAPRKYVSVMAQKQ